MAAQGLKVAVLTIDPAKRLANSLGLPELGNEERLVDPERFAAHGIEMKGELWAMMLDAKRTFDDLVERHAPDEETRDRILQNRIYQEISNAMAGSQEYMAMEKLYELHQEARYDLLVLDTPPTRHALDFIDAPERMSRFIEGRSLQFFLKPGRLGVKVLGRSGGVLFSALKRITGIDLLQDLSEFFQSFGNMAEGFSERAQRVKELLAHRDTTFVLVTAPQREAIDEGVYFWRRLKEARLPFGGVVVNKVHHDFVRPLEPGSFGADEPETADEETIARLPGELEQLLGDTDLGGRVYENFDNYRALAARDHGAAHRAPGGGLCPVRSVLRRGRARHRRPRAGQPLPVLVERRAPRDAGERRRLTRRPRSNPLHRRPARSQHFRACPDPRGAGPALRSLASPRPPCGPRTPEEEDRGGP
jgi:anion-transporting  ArsA/GET3 family ATPase